MLLLIIDSLQTLIPEKRFEILIQRKYTKIRAFMILIADKKTSANLCGNVLLTCLCHMEQTFLG